MPHELERSPLNVFHCFTRFPLIHLFCPVAAKPSSLTSRTSILPNLQMTLSSANMSQPVQHHFSKPEGARSQSLMHSLLRTPPTTHLAAALIHLRHHLNMLLSNFSPSASLLFIFYNVHLSLLGPQGSPFSLFVLSYVHHSSTAIPNILSIFQSIYCFVLLHLYPYPAFHVGQIHELDRTQFIGFK